MKRHRLTEPEVVSGIVLRNPHRRTSAEEDIRASIKCTYDRLVQDVRTAAIKLWRKKKDGNKSALETEQIYALAAYQVTYLSTVQQEVEEKLGIKDTLDTLYNESVMLSGIPVEKNVPLGSQDAAPQITPAWVMAPLTQLITDLSYPSRGHSGGSCAASRTLPILKYTRLLRAFECLSDLTLKPLHVASAQISASYRGCMYAFTVLVPAAVQQSSL